MENVGHIQVFISEDYCVMLMVRKRHGNQVAFAVLPPECAESLGKDLLKAAQIAKMSRDVSLPEFSLERTNLS